MDKASYIWMVSAESNVVQVCLGRTGIPVNDIPALREVLIVVSLVCLGFGLIALIYALARWLLTHDAPMRVNRLPSEDELKSRREATHKVVRGWPIKP